MKESDIFAILPEEIPTVESFEVIDTGAPK